MSKFETKMEFIVELQDKIRFLIYKYAKQEGVREENINDIDVLSFLYKNNNRNVEKYINAMEFLQNEDIDNENAEYHAQRLMEIYKDLDNIV